MTLLEILIVIALIAVVSTLALVGFGGILQGGQEDSVRTFVNTGLKTPLTQYRIHNGSFPTTEQGLDALLRKPQNAGSRWRGPYIDELPEDAWNEPYQYKFPGTRNPLGAAGFDLWSSGPDRTSGTADDIGNWDDGAAQN